MDIWKEIVIKNVASYKLDGDSITLVLKSKDRMYSEAFKKYGLSSEGVLWGNQKDHEIRLNKFCERIPKGADILDVGSGTGLLYKRLWELQKDVTYKGIDSLSDYIEYTKNLAKVELVNLFDYNTRHDCVVAVGTLHLGFDDTIHQAIKHMLLLAKKRLIFTILSDKNIGPHFTICELNDALKTIRSIKPFANITHEKLPFQFEEYLIMVDLDG